MDRYLVEADGRTFALLIDGLAEVTKRGSGDIAIAWGPDRGALAFVSAWATRLETTGDAYTNVVVALPSGGCIHARMFLTQSMGTAEFVLAHVPNFSRVA